MKYFTLLILIMSSHVSAEVYKWTDENGQVHYSQQKPLDQLEKAETVAITPAPKFTPKPAKAPVEESASNKNGEELFFEPKLSRKEIREKNEQEAQYCASASKSLEIINSGALVRTKDESGEFRYLTESQTAERKKKAEEAIAAYCK